MICVIYVKQHYYVSYLHTSVNEVYENNFDLGQNNPLSSLELVWPNSELGQPRSKSLIIIIAT